MVLCLFRVSGLLLFVFVYADHNIPGTVWYRYTSISWTWGEGWRFAVSVLEAA